MSDPLYPESCAYHEAGHIVVAALLGLSIHPSGIHLDETGRGRSFYDYREPDNLPGVDAKGRHSVTSIFAGLIAQRKFHPTCSSASAAGDEVMIRELLDEMYWNEPESRNEAEHELRDEAGRLIRTHWSAIEVIARELWGGKYTARRWEPDKSWTSATLEKRVTGHRVQEILNGFGVQTSVMDVSIDEEEQRGNIQNEMRTERIRLLEQKHPDRSELLSRIGQLETRLGSAKGPTLVQIVSEWAALQNLINATRPEQSR